MISMYIYIHIIINKSHIIINESHHTTTQVVSSIGVCQVMSHTIESCPTRTSHVPYAQVLSHMNESCLCKATSKKVMSSVGVCDELCTSAFFFFKYVRVWRVPAHVGEDMCVCMCVCAGVCARACV